MMKVQITAPYGADVEDTLQKALSTVQKKRERKFDDRALAARQREMDKHIKVVWNNMLKEIREVLDED